MQNPAPQKYAQQKFVRKFRFLMKTPCQALCILLAVSLVTATAWGQTSDPASKRYVDPLVQRWQMGLILQGGDGASIGVTAAAPIPGNWPEQHVEIVGRDVTENVARVSFRDVADGARQMVISIPRLEAGATARAILTFEVTRSAIVAPSNPAAFVVPTRRTSELAPFLTDSPSIEARHVTIRNVAKEITAEAPQGWPQVEAIYDFVQDKLTYKEGDLKGALDALKDGEGDCEAYTSLFVALCRASGVPARTVWVPGHCYPEFYLEDKAGNGYWMPCQSAGDREFGGMRDRRPILQKGDNVRLPEERKPLRYARAVMTIRDSQGRTPPTVEHVLRPSPKE
ncbi:MAG: transglutaminase-like domain-containing protein [Pirellulaceae bacterium]